MNNYLVRDENGEPVTRLVERDRYGRFITPYYGYIWRDSDLATEQEKTITSIPRPQDGDEPAPEDPAARMRELERTIELLNTYGDAKFGDEWWPGNARHWIPDGRELEYLLDPGSARLADREDTRSGEAS